MAVGDKSGGQYSKLSAHGNADETGALADYEIDIVNLELIKDIFGACIVSENDEVKI